MKRTETFLRRRRFLTVMPVLIYPFLCLVFWGLGGGQASAEIVKAPEKNGLNIHLPDAQLPDKSTDLLSLYDKAARDSAKLRELRQIEARNWGVDSVLPVPDLSAPSSSLQGSYGNSRTDMTEAKVNERLALLKKSLELASTPLQQQAPAVPSNPEGEENLKRMEALLNTASEPKTEVQDPEIRTLNGMLDKILEIQNPGRNQRKEMSQKEAGRIFTLSEEKQPVRLVMSGTKIDSIHSPQALNRFYAVSDKTDERQTHNAVKAMIYEGGKFASGAKVKLMLGENIYLNGIEVPKGTFVYGIGEVTNERLKIKINSIGVDNSIFKVDLSVYDTDALEGVSAPGAITRNEVKDGTAGALQALDFNNYDPSLGAQAASAGIATAKSILTKKAKTVFAHVKQGRHVFLMDNKQNQ